MIREILFRFFSGKRRNIAITINSPPKDLSRVTNFQHLPRDCAIPDPNSWYPTSNSKLKKKNFMHFTNAIGMNGKFYALSMQGTLAVIEYVDSTLKVTSLCEQRAVPSVLTPWSYFKEYLVEFDGKVLVVFLNYGKFGGEWSVKGVEVMRLNEEEGKLSWVKMKSLGEMSVFIGENCCICGLASDFDCRCNFVYFTQRKNGHEWWMYDFESGRISPPVVLNKLFIDNN